MQDQVNMIEVVYLLEFLNFLMLQFVPVNQKQLCFKDN